MNLNHCIGCKTFFNLNEVLPLQSLTIQFKNYGIPIKEIRLKITLLKTIVAFLNSKGGTIYIGVDDSSGKVYGVQMKRKQMDQFRLVIKQLIQKIQPEVDLVKKEEVSLQYIPVIQNDGQFYGKYIVKIIVLQGDPSKLYCFSQKIQIKSANTEFCEIILSCKRHNMGGISQIKGIELIHQIYEKATNPHEKYYVYHEGCNPKPLIKEQTTKSKKLKLIKGPQETKSNQKSKQKCKEIHSTRKFQKIFEQQKKTQTNSQSSDIKELSKSKENSNKLQFTSKRFSSSIIQKQNKNFNMEQKSSKNIPQEDDDKTLYLSNIRPDMKESLIKYLTFSMTNKIQKSIRVQKDYIKLTFESTLLKNSFYQICQGQAILKNLNQFGINHKIKFKKRTSKFQKPNIKNQIQESKSPERLKQTQKNIIIFKNFQSAFEKSLLNYLEKCMTTSIKRTAFKHSEHIELQFQDKKSLNIFYKLATQLPHIRQLNHYGENGKIKIQKLKQNQKKKIKPQQKKNNHQRQTSESQLIKQEQFKNTILVASNIQSKTAKALKNYLTSNMNYNIKKKIILSQLMHYLMLQFQSETQMRKFWSYVKTSPHDRLLNQFSSLASFRIGIPGRNLLIANFNQNKKQQLKKKITDVLGRGIVKKGQTKIINQNINVWILSLVNVATIYKNYEKLVQEFKNPQVNAKFRNGNSSLTIYIDYVEL